MIINKPDNSSIHNNMNNHNHMIIFAPTASPVQNACPGPPASGRRGGGRSGLAARPAAWLRGRILEGAKGGPKEWVSQVTTDLIAF